MPLPSLLSYHPISIRDVTTELFFSRIMCNLLFHTYYIPFQFINRKMRVLSLNSSSFLSSIITGSNSSFNILSSDPPALPDRPVLTKPTQTINVSSGRPTTLNTTNNSITPVTSSISTVGDHDNPGSPRGKIITTPNDDSHTTQHQNNSNSVDYNADNSKKQIHSPIVTSRFESNPNTIRNRSRPLPPLPPTPIRSSSITRTENSITHHHQLKQINPISNSINGIILSGNETAPPLPERKVSCNMKCFICLRIVSYLFVCLIYTLYSVWKYDFSKHLSTN
ncbi:unnamed protein product [Schistosoma curassoni]|uniref:Uncharacterized protein n=1 Tax=Schistosoma curassoni TaxID=6186 RepID=A0A183L2K2_9TREM|nr:unnamed protein product [Schistosoma curassoni]